MSEATRIAALQLAISIGGRVTDEIILERARTFDAYLAEEPISDNTIEAHDGEIEHHDVVAKHPPVPGQLKFSADDLCARCALRIGRHQDQEHEFEPIRA